MSKEKIFLVDAHALCYRAFYAIRELKTSQGQPTNAVYGFVQTLRKLLRDYNPQYLAVCFDSKEKTKREEKYAEYKIQRPSMPEGLIEQVAVIKDVIKAYNLPILECPGYEADDLIATVAKQAAEKKLDVIIVSDDKDMYQLANKTIQFLSARQDRLMGHDDLAKHLGFDPHLIADYIGLVGDKTDNIPGVRGVGKVTATKLINEYGSLDKIYRNLDKISQSSVKNKLKEQKEDAYFSRDLALLEEKAPLEFHIDQMKVSKPDREKLFEIFKDLEFRRLAQEMAPEENEDDTEVEIQAIQTKADAKAFKSAAKGKDFAFVINKNKESVYLALKNKPVSRVPFKLLPELLPLLKDKSSVKAGFNIKESYKFLCTFVDEEMPGAFDVMVAAYLLQPSHTAMDLKQLLWGYLSSNAVLEDRPEKEVQGIFDLHLKLKEELKEKSLDKLFETIEMPLTYVLSIVESEGVKVDVDFLGKLSKDCEKKIGKLSQKVFNISKAEFNLNSPKQLSEVLFQKLKLPIIKRTKTGISTDESVLNMLANEHEIAGLILEYRQLNKLKSTYIDAIPKLVNEQTGRVHTEFNQLGAETGRLSSRNPNLQNLPVRTELGRQIRKAIIASGSSNVLVAADYSQVELRILAHLSKDEALIKAFRDGEDIHNYTASLIFEVPEDKITQEMRYATKRVNFGIIYGMSAFGLAKDLGITQPEAQEFIDKYFLRYPKVKGFMDEQIKFCEKNGYVSTLFHRRRYIPEIGSKNPNVRQFAQRQAINTPVQGSAADLMKLAMIDIQKEIEKKKLKSKMVLTVHDELVFDIPEKERGEMVNLVHDKMEHAVKLDVPVGVTVKTGKNWLEMKDA